MRRVRAAKSCTTNTIARILGDFDGYDSDISDLEVLERSSDEGDYCRNDGQDLLWH